MVGVKDQTVTIWIRASVKQIVQLSKLLVEHEKKLVGPFRQLE